MEQSGNGLASRMTMDRNAAGVMADSPALIPLVGNNSRFDFYSNANAYIYTNHMVVGFHLSLSLFGFLPIHIPIYYLFTIIPMDYSSKSHSFSSGETEETMNSPLI